MALLYLLVFFFIITIPILIFFLIYRWLNKKGYTILAWVVPVIIIAFLAYPIYTAVYPRNDFYVKEFETNTTLSFPASGKIIAKEATYPDQHGDYSSWAVIELSPADYHSLFKGLQTNPTFKPDTSTNFNLSETIDFFDSNGIDSSKIKTILTTVKEAQFKVGFIADGRTIIFERHSS